MFRHKTTRARVRGEDGVQYISHVRTTKDEDKVKGHAHIVMNKVKRYADVHKKDSRLVAVPDKDEDEEKLHKFYNKHGYFHEKGTPYMIRKYKEK